jgi:hypothetical protein
MATGWAMPESDSDDRGPAALLYGLRTVGGSFELRGRTYVLRDWSGDRWSDGRQSFNVFNRSGQSRCIIVHRHERVVIVHPGWWTIADMKAELNT